MIAFVANLFGYILKLFNFICGNFGIAILLFTLFTKLLLLPLVIKQQKSMKQMAKVQPKLQELQDRYKEDNDREKYAMEVTKLQKEENFNPLTGCLLSLIQIPIIIAMFYIVRQPLTYMEKIDKDQLTQYIEALPKDENGNAKVTRGYEEIAVIKENPDLNFNLNFLGLNLGEAPANNKENYYYLIIPILSIAITGLSIWITNKMNNDINKNNPQYEETQKSMAMMNYMLPITSGLIAYNAPLGLGLYWLVSNILQAIQNFVLRRYFKEPENNKLIEGKVIKEENS